MTMFFTQPWSVKTYIKFVLPSVMSIITISLYMMVDAIFVSRFAGPLALAGVNIIMPLFSLCLGGGIMVASGASAMVGIELGKGESDRASQYFSLVFCFLLGVTALIFFGIQFVGGEHISRILGASKALMPYCTDYLEFFVFGMSLVVIQLFFEYFIRLDGKPMWAFAISLASGLTNGILDYWLIGHLGMGIKGAGIASSAGIGVAVTLGGLYFCFRSGSLKPTKPVWDLRFLWRTMVNGSSEMATELSSGVKILVFNLVIIQYAGEAGVAALAILMNLYFLLSSFYIGLSMGTAPVVSVNFGGKNFSKIRELVRRALISSIGVSILVFALAKFQGQAIVSLFTRDPDVVNLTLEGLGIFAFTFLVNGITILASGFFTAVGNGRVSALIACLNSFVLTLGFVAVLPKYLNITGIWLSIPLAEAAAMVLSICYFLKYRPMYYRPEPIGVTNETIAYHP